MTSPMRHARERPSYFIAEYSLYRRLAASAVPRLTGCGNLRPCSEAQYASISAGSSARDMAEATTWRPLGAPDATYSAAICTAAERIWAVLRSHGTNR